MEINNIMKFIIFKKGHSKQKGRCPDTMDTSLDPPLASIYLP